MLLKLSEDRAFWRIAFNLQFWVDFPWKIVGNGFEAIKESQIIEEKKMIDNTKREEKPEENQNSTALG